jgi:hypothetical protein
MDTLRRGQMCTCHSHLIRDLTTPTTDVSPNGNKGRWASFRFNFKRRWEICVSVFHSTNLYNYPCQNAFLRSTVMTAYKYHLYSFTAGPSLNRAVGTLRARSLTPCFASRRRLSNIIQVPKPIVRRNPVPPKAAVVASAGIYFGASLFWKMFETTPMRFARGTPKLVRMRRLPSCAILLLYQTSRRTDGADVPLHYSWLVVSRGRLDEEGNSPSHHE